MRSRLELQEILEDILGVRNAYYQPPASKQMHYPAIVYSRSNIQNIYADNAVYRQDRSYELVVIDPNPESEIVDKISLLPMCRFVRHYVANNLNYDVFEIYF